ncbi:GGDEF domain-containing protein [Mycobacterium ahvazicum]|nr:GGDEF domain-containing protein [Mycobacterium ahvazicum]
MPWRTEPRPTTRVWHAIGLTAFLVMLSLYAAAGYIYRAGFSPGFLWVLGGCAVAAVLVAVLGRWRGWQERRALLFGWPVASLLGTVLVGAVEPGATQNLPGIVTVTFGYIGLTCARWRSLAFVPLGVAAFVVGGSKALPGSLTTVVLAAAMWVIVAEVPAWLIAQLEEQSALLRKIAQTDALTQLFDRSTLAAQLSTHADSSAVALIDLDNFKSYNDAYGHEAGDDVLIAFADAIRSSVRIEDIAFRIGGDEFLLLLVGNDRAEAEQVVDRLRHRWAELGEPVGFSAGIASGEQDLMRLADQHMYANKRSRDLPAD